MNDQNLLATPTENVDVSTLLGKKARYIDKNDKIWPAVVKAVEDPFVVIEFEVFPSGLGQGQIIEILNDHTDM